MNFKNIFTLGNLDKTMKSFDKSIDRFNKTNLDKIWGKRDD